MANIENLNDEILETAAGGANINTTDWRLPHWQPTNHTMGSTWTEYGYTWYRIKIGDTLGAIAKKFGRTVQALVAMNSDTITNPNNIYAGDAIKVG